MGAGTVCLGEGTELVVLAITGGGLTAQHNTTILELYSHKNII